MYQLTLLSEKKMKTVSNSKVFSPQIQSSCVELSKTFCRTGTLAEKALGLTSVSSPKPKPNPNRFCSAGVGCKTEKEMERETVRLTGGDRGKLTNARSLHVTCILDLFCGDRNDVEALISAGNSQNKRFFLAHT